MIYLKLKRQFFLVLLFSIFMPFGVSQSLVFADSSNSNRCEEFSFGDPQLIIKPKGFLAEGTFGPEFTFTNEKVMAKTPEGIIAKTIAFERIKNFLTKRCAFRNDCYLTIGSDKHGGNFTVTYTDGWFFRVGIDNRCLESQVKKGTYYDYVNQKERLQRDLFDAMETIGLRPDDRVGGGHIHIGSDYFMDKPILFRDFFADFANFPQLPFGAFKSVGDVNAPPIAAQHWSQQLGLVKALAEFDSLENPSLVNMTWFINRDVYTIPFSNLGFPAYYQAIRLERLFWLDGAGTFELRGYRAQKSVDEFLLQIEIIGARMDYLARLNRRIQFLPQVNPDWSQQTIVNTFYRYVTDSGLSWNRYRELLPPQLHKLKPGQPEKW